MKKYIWFSEVQFNIMGKAVLEVNFHSITSITKYSKKKKNQKEQRVNIFMLTIDSSF